MLHNKKKKMGKLYEIKVQRKFRYSDITIGSFKKKNHYFF